MLDITVKNLSFSYKKKEVLKNINVTFEKGKITGILGSNGSGKSTLLKNILGYLQPNYGDIFVEDENIKNFCGAKIATTFALVPQKSGLNIPLTVYDIVLMGRISKIKNSFLGYSKEDKDIVDKILVDLNLWHLKDLVIFEISGGEFQRTLLARALAQESKILLLDESTSSLDMKYVLDIMNIISGLVKKGLTCISIMHDLNLASMYCDNIVFLKNGEVIYQGTTKEMFKAEILKDVYDFDCDIITNNGNLYVLPSKTTI